MDLAKFVYRLSQDEGLSSQFRDDPESMVEKLGLDLTKTEVASLVSVVTSSRKRFPREPRAGRDW